MLDFFSCNILFVFVVLIVCIRGDEVSFGTAGKVPSGAVKKALEAGFRSFDTARAEEWYNEDEVARAVSLHPRQDIHITTKIHPRDLGYEETLRAGRDSAAKFGGYVDVLLLHFPRCWKDLCGEGEFGSWRESWRAIEDLRLEGSVRGGGVSNFNAKDLEDLGEIVSSGGGAVMVVQDWHDPFHQATAQRSFCSQQPACRFQAYSSLGGQWLYQSPNKNVVTSSSTLKRISEAHKCSIPTLVLSWQLQQGINVIPRSTNPEHIWENAKLLLKENRVILTEDEMALMEALDGRAMNSAKSEL